MNKKLEIALLSVTLVVVLIVSLVSSVSMKREMKLERGDFESRHKVVSNELTEKGLELKSSKEELEKKDKELEEFRVRIESLETTLEGVKEERSLEVDKLNGEIKKLKQSASTPKVSRGVSTKEVTTVSQNSSNNSGTFQATAYCSCTICCGKNAKGITATGTKVTPNRTIAVDPKVIPLGSKVTVEGYGTYIAEDTGSAVKGNIIDIYFSSHAEALKFGRKSGLKVSW